MAEALARERFGETIRVASAGLHPQTAGDAQMAINALRVHFQIDASGHAPRDVRALDLAEYDRIIAMDKYVARELKTLTAHEVLVWNIKDPWGSDGYKQCGLSILKALNHLDLG